MKLSVAWLREHVDSLPEPQSLASQLTLAGLEVANLVPVAPAFSGVVVGKLLDVAPHPHADKLTVCRVDDGSGERLAIVCGAPNVHAGMTAPLARVGARLPGGQLIRAARLRGIESRGMLCSASELGLGSDRDGILELSGNLDSGADLREALALDDVVLDIELTPNRGDCMSVTGIARELAVINAARVRSAPAQSVDPISETEFRVEVRAEHACPRFAGRVVEGIDASAQSPLWMTERLRRSGIRPIHPVVDVTNYVMLELGQPMHGYDLACLDGRVVVRFAERGEHLELLGERVVDLDPGTLVIADAGGAVGLAGILGGARTAVSAATEDVFLESAFFAPACIAGRARRYGLVTDASQRFERGVDYELQARAIERATALLIESAGGVPGPLIEVTAPHALPQRDPVILRHERLQRLLGLQIDVDRVAELLRRLSMRVEAVDRGWRVIPPSFRFDIAIEEDLVEEVGRIHGYNKVPATPARITQRFMAHRESALDRQRLKHLLVDRGYQEAITYGFTDPALQSVLAPDAHVLELANPISSEHSVMRASLWPGLVAAARDNLNRQQERLRLFEVGVIFSAGDTAPVEQETLAGIVAGADAPEQWGLEHRPADVFDVKADVEAVLRLTGRFTEFVFEAAHHPALRPGQTARILREGEPAGWLGAMHPEIARHLGLDRSPLLFEVDLQSIADGRIPAAVSLSRFPVIRRDLAMIVDESVSWQTLETEAKGAAGPFLQAVEVFDVYRGTGIDSGLKSIALSLIFQETSRTLTDEEADAAVQAVVAWLADAVNARIRD
ncbi:phenylalanine--tRNA ligase subunit beta [soil metagenome]